MDTPPKKNTQKNETSTSKSIIEISSSSDPTNVVEPREDKSTSNEEVAPETEVEKDASLGKEASIEMELPHCSGTNPDTFVAAELLNCKSLNDSEVYRRLMMKTPSTSETSVGSNNVPQSSDYEVNSGAMNNSPRIGLHRNDIAMSSKKKRVKLDSGEGKSCKRCNCKKSKCLKLYCECFSAEVYCTGRCSCVDCFNRPIHKNTILATCKQIESRNPGAFDPKVIRKVKLDSGEVESCRRCNCKKSKCLKLYCECFSAEVYCTGRCSCVDCFNRPIHKDTILATCKQIESRNPGAFAPKVIRGSETRNDSSKAQARVHLNSGCNCKKTNCLPKLCGCYKDGLDCCKYCRCEGCQNKFGRKDG